jgi:hypothetical protein
VSPLTTTRRADAEAVRARRGAHLPSTSFTRTYKSVSSPTVAHVGAEFIGTILAAHLLQQFAEPSRRILLLDRTTAQASDVVVGLASARHILNVSAGRMSAFRPDDDHVPRFANGGDVRVSRGNVVARRLYGACLEDTRRTAVFEGVRHEHRLERRAAEVAAMTPAADAPQPDRQGDRFERSLSRLPRMRRVAMPLHVVAMLLLPVAIRVRLGEIAARSAFDPS